MQLILLVLIGIALIPSFLVIMVMLIELTGVHQPIHRDSWPDRERSTSICEGITNEGDLSREFAANMLGLVDIDLSGKSQVEKKIPKSDEVKPGVESTSVPAHKPMKTGNLWSLFIPNHPNGLFSESTLHTAIRT